MTDAVLISIVTSTAAAVTAALSAYFSYRAKITANETHEIVNSRMTEFMAMAKKSFLAEGAEQEKRDASVRDAAAIVSRAEGAAQEKSESRLEQLDRPPQATAPPVADVSTLATAIKSVPEKTAVKVVEKLSDK